MGAGASQMARALGWIPWDPGDHEVTITPSPAFLISGDDYISTHFTELIGRATQCLQAHGYEHCLAIGFYQKLTSCEEACATA